MLVAVVRVLSQTEPLPVSQEYEHALPAHPETLPLEDVPKASRLTPDQSQAPGTIELDISLAQLTVEVGPAGQPVQVQADYDSASCELEESFELAEDGQWVYRVEFGPRRGLFNMLARDKISGNRVTLIIPKGYRTALNGDIGTGEARLELGGLDLSELDLEMGPGSHEISFAEPTPSPLTRFVIDSSIGELDVQGLGNASPAQVRIDHTIGDMNVDLSGGWRTDSEIGIDFSIGSCNVNAGSDAQLDVEKASVTLGESYRGRRSREQVQEQGKPQLTLRVSGFIGEIRL